MEQASLESFMGLSVVGDGSHGSLSHGGIKPAMREKKYFSVVLIKLRDDKNRYPYP